MGISANPIAIWLAALVGSAAAFGQSSPVLMGAAAYGDWRSDAPAVRRKITPADMPPPYATASANNGPTVADRGAVCDVVAFARRRCLAGVASRFGS